MAGFRDDLINNVKNTAAGIPSALMSGGIGAGFGFINNLMQNMFQRRLMKQQFEYQQKAFEAENLRQDYLMNNSASIMKNNLRNAGYSTADPNGTGVQTPNTNNLATPNMTFSNAGDMNMAEMLNRNALLSAQIENIKADTKSKLSNADYIQVQLDQYRDTYAERVETTKQQLISLLQGNRKASADASISELQYQYDSSTLADRVASVGVALDKLKSERDIVRLDSSFNAITFDSRVKKVDAELAKIKFDASISQFMSEIKSVEANLAHYGVLLGNNLLGTLLGVAVTGKANFLGEQLTSFFEQIEGVLTEGLPESIGNLIGSIWQKISGYVGEAAGQNAESIIDYANEHQFNLGAQLLVWFIKNSRKERTDKKMD